MSETKGTDSKKSHLSSPRWVIHSLTSGESKAKTTLRFGIWNGDPTLQFTIRRDNDPKDAKGIFVSVGMDVFSMQTLLDATKQAANTEGKFDPFTINTVDADVFDRETRRFTPGELKSKITVYKTPAGVVCWAVEDVKNGHKSTVQLLHSNKKAFHKVTINKEPITDAQQSRIFVNAFVRQISLGIALESYRTYVPYDKNAQRGGNNNYQKPQTQAPQSSMNSSDSIVEDDIPY